MATPRGRATVRRCTVYRGRGEQEDSTDDLPEEAVGHPSMAALHVIMTRDLVCAHADLELAAVPALIVRLHVGCLPIVDDERRPIGVLDRLDLVELLGAPPTDGSSSEDVAPRFVSDVMSPIQLALDEHTSITRAAAMMLKADAHHVLAVSSTGKLVGVVSAKDLVGWFLEMRPPRRARTTSSPPWHPLEG